MTPLISHQFSIDDGDQAMTLLTSQGDSLGILLRYPSEAAAESTVVAISRSDSVLVEPTPGRVAIIGAGNYAGRTLIPAFRSAGAKLQTLVSESGVSAFHFARKHGFQEATTEVDAALADSVDTVVIATRHNTHAELVINALHAGKHVYCEKPLCLTLTELEQIEAITKERPALGLVVGFNRRRAALIKKMTELLKPISEPKSVVMTINAGAIPSNHWTQDPVVGGGRIIGEACHFVDLARYLIGAPISGASVITHDSSRESLVAQDKAVISLNFADGSIASINYLADGHRGFPKERIEVFTAGKILQLNNFISLKGWGWKSFNGTRKFRQDKGVEAFVAETLNAIRSGGSMPISLEEILEVSRTSILLSEQASK